jgi:hypothetical protein
MRHLLMTLALLAGCACGDLERALFLRTRVTARAADERCSIVVCLSAGARDGVRPGDRFTVERDGRFIGVVEVEAVAGSSCRGLLVDMEADVPEVGDLATR